MSSKSILSTQQTIQMDIFSAFHSKTRSCQFSDEQCGIERIPYESVFIVTMIENGCYGATRIIVLTFLIGLNNCAGYEIERSKYFAMNWPNQKRLKDRLQHQTHLSYSLVTCLSKFISLDFIVSFFFLFSRSPTFFLPETFNSLISNAAGILAINQIPTETNRTQT